MAAELDGSGNLVKQFVYADGVNSPDYMIYQGKKFQFLKDHRGSITMVVDSVTGEMKQKIKYSDWGEVLEDTNPGLISFGYAGGMYDQDTKLVRFGARDYDPQVGRWLSKDPIRFDGGDTNLYGYVGQDPVNYKDSNGMEFDSEDIKKAWENAIDALRRGREKVGDTIRDIQDWGDRIIKDAEEALDKFDPTKDKKDSGAKSC